MLPVLYYMMPMMQAIRLMYKIEEEEKWSIKKN